MTHIDNGTIHYRDELVRKLIHLFSLSIPIIYYFIPSSTSIAILIGFTIFALIVDGGRFISKSFAKVFYQAFGFLLRKHELDKEKNWIKKTIFINEQLNALHERKIEYY